MSNGLLVMYVFFALIIANLFKSKWEDKHQQQEQ